MTKLTLTINRSEVLQQVFRRSEYIGFRQCGGLNGIKEKSASERDSQLLDGYWLELYSRLISHLAARFAFIDKSTDASRLQFEIITVR